MLWRDRVLTEVFHHVFHHLPFSCGHFAFTALELPVKGRLEERLHPRVHVKQKRQGKYRSFPLTWKAQTTSSLSMATGMSADRSCCYTLNFQVILEIQVNRMSYLSASKLCLHSHPHLPLFLQYAKSENHQVSPSFIQRKDSASTGWAKSEVCVSRPATFCYHQIIMFALNLWDCSHFEY